METHPSLKQGDTQFAGVAVGASVSTAVPARDQINARGAKAWVGRQSLGTV